MSVKEPKKTSHWKHIDDIETEIRVYNKFRGDQSALWNGFLVYSSDFIIRILHKLDLHKLY